MRRRISCLNIRIVPSLFLVVALVILVYYDLPSSFFQQDEWSAFGHLIHRRSLGFGKALQDYFLSSSGFVHLTPLNVFFYQVEFELFGLEFSGYAWVSLTLHLVNTFLVYYLAWLLFKKKTLALPAALLFGLNSFSHQAVTWIATSINTQGSCLFFLLSLVFLMREQPILSVLAFAISLGFKETTIFLFLFLPFAWLVFSKKRNFASLKKILIPLSGFGLPYLGLRVLLWLNAPFVPLGKKASLFQPSQATYIYRLVSLPVKILPQSFFSAGQILSWAEDWVRLVYPQFFVSPEGVVNPYIRESVAFDLISFALTVILFLGIIYLYFCFRKKKEARSMQVLVFSLALIFGSGLPLLLIPGKAGYASIVEPRNLYLPAVGASLLLALAIFTLAQRWGRKTWLFFLIPLLFLHIKNIRQNMELLVDRSQARKSILEEIKSLYPRLPKEVVFYTESDMAYYGLPPEEKILPFQSGFGQTLLIWYHESEKFPPCFHQDVFLYEITSQGYRFCGARGFGYFRDFDKLITTLEKENLPAESIYAFAWLGRKGKLVETTDLVRQKIKER